MTGTSSGWHPDRSGFTLIEVLVAVVLTSIVALVAYGVAQVSVDTRAQIDAGLRAVQSDRAVRQTLVDLLHNLRAPRQRGDTSLILKGDTLWFVAAGTPPLDPAYDWLVEIHPGPGGLEFASRSLGRSPTARVAFRVPRLTQWQVRVLARGDSRWRETWSEPALLPSAVTLSFADSGLPGQVLMVKLPEVLPSVGDDEVPSPE